MPSRREVTREDREAIRIKPKRKQLHADSAKQSEGLHTAGSIWWWSILEHFRCGAALRC